MKTAIRLGTAGWSIPGQHAALFPGSGTHLERYAHRLPGVEINSSFYRPHKPATYARWAASVPPDFRFAVKAPREITHLLRLVEAAAPLERFIAAVGELGEKLGPILVQLPPSLDYDETAAVAFFELLRARFDGLVACEPRHRGWFTERAGAALARLRIARVVADPSPAEEAKRLGGWRGLVYYRLHGAPDIYRSGYPTATIASFAERLRLSAADGVEAWCIFDNTALGAAVADALALDAMLRSTNLIA